MPKEAGKGIKKQMGEMGNKQQNVTMKTNHINIYIKCKQAKYIFKKQISSDWMKKLE